MDPVAKIISLWTSESVPFRRETLDAHDTFRITPSILLPQLPEPVEDWNRAIA